MALSRRQFLLSSAAVLVAPTIPVPLSPLVAADFAEVEKRLMPMGTVTGRWSSGHLAPGTYNMDLQTIKRVGNTVRVVGNVFFPEGERHIIIHEMHGDRRHWSTGILEEDYENPG